MDYTDVEGMSAEEKTLRLAWEKEAPHMCFRDWLIAEVLRLREENAKLDKALEIACMKLSQGFAEEAQAWKRQLLADSAMYHAQLAAAELGKEPPR